MHLQRPARRAARRAVAAGLVASLLVVAGCSGSSLGDDTDRPTDGTITVGLLWPQSGVYKDIGDDQARGWQLYLDTRGGTLGGRKVTAVTADEGEGKQTATKNATKLLEQDKATVLVGTASAEAVASIETLVTERKVPFIGTGGRPSTLKDVSYIWHTSWLSRETGRAIADYLRFTVAGPVYVIGPDYVGGHDQIGGFVDAYTAAGGKLANKDGKPKWLPFPTTTNFLPFFNEIAAENPKAVYTFYAGAPAIEFVKQYEQSGLKGKVPLYGAGFLTEGTVLAAQGQAAKGVRTVLNYAPNLDNAANRRFVTDYQAQYGTAPNLYNLTGYDAAQVLDRAIAAAGANPTRASINTAIGGLGEIQSPRGSWRFGAQHSPTQTWYLREVRDDGRVLANEVIENLTTLGS